MNPYDAASRQMLNQVDDILMLVAMLAALAVVSLALVDLYTTRLRRPLRLGVGAGNLIIWLWMLYATMTSLM